MYVHLSHSYISPSPMPRPLPGGNNEHILGCAESAICKKNATTDHWSHDNFLLNHSYGDVKATVAIALLAVAMEIM